MSWDTERETIRRETQRGRQASWNADVIVPAGQALLIAAGVGVGAFVLTMVLAVARGWTWWLPFAASGALGGLSFAIAAVLLTMDHRRLLWAAEALTGVDIDSDDVVGKPEPQDVLRVELMDRNEGNHRRLTYIDLPGDRDQLATLARGLLNGKGTGQAQWTGTAGPFTRSEYEAIRATMIQRGLATWINPKHHNQGWELNAAGRAIMQRIADRPTPDR